MNLRRLIIIWERLICSFCLRFSFIIWIWFNVFRLVWCLIVGLNNWILFIISWLRLIRDIFSLVAWIHYWNSFVFFFFSIIFNIQVFFFVFCFIAWVHNWNCFVFISFSFIFKILAFYLGWIINFIRFVWRNYRLSLIFLFFRIILSIVVN